LVIWRDALDLAWAHPWTGVGLNGYMDAITTRFDDTWYRNVTSDHVLDSPHDLLVQAAVVAGIPGVVLVLVAAALVSLSGIRAARGAVG
ncbi:O-antigen ligase family protein, partial [Escherichia coli]|uniref:O-antigen ligase family protein n=1 Tax=Escherichia coli TaxID=562 RepID=UPI003CE4C53C